MCPGVCYLKECSDGVVVGTAGAAAHMLAGIDNADGDCSHAGLFISEVGEGSSNNKWVELYNPTDSPMSLNDYSLQVYANGNTEPHSTFALDSFTVAPGSTLLICHSHAKLPGASGADSLRADHNCKFLDDFSPSPGEFSANGDDAVVLLHDGAVLDTIGVIGTRPASHSWPVDDGSGNDGGAKDHTLVRIAAVVCGTANWEEVGMHQWRVMDRNDFSSIGVHTCACGSTSHGGHRRQLQLSGLMGQIGSCPMEQFQLRIQETDRICCSSGCGGQMVPEVCDPECAVVWNDLFSDCATTLSSMVVRFITSPHAGVFIALTVFHLSRGTC